MKQLAIFGGSGFVGRHVIRRLAKEGAVIRVPARDPDKALFLKPAGDVGQIVPFHCNPRSDASVASAIGNSGAVINLIGIIAEQGRTTFQSVHVEMAARIARLAREQGATHFIQMSALLADAHGTSSYARSKAAGEDAVRAFFPEATILRPSLIFGPEDHFFNQFAAMARYMPALPLIGGGMTKFQPVYVGDIAHAIAEILYRPEAMGRIYELGGPEVYSFRELLELMLRETGRRRGFINVPWNIAELKAAVLGLLPNPPLTRDQVAMLKTDSVIADKTALTLHNLGIAPTALEMILPTYLDRFRAGGRLGAAA
ncbi:MAG TPA: complex I NDUFA9 subunit family protein [Alphaproteobacteria bacterium]|nr:complex I NDUFA9 subunit family protein [Alphaproteobacteria bacterium]